MDAEVVAVSGKENDLIAERRPPVVLNPLHEPMVTGLVLRVKMGESFKGASLRTSLNLHVHPPTIRPSREARMRCALTSATSIILERFEALSAVLP